MKLKMDDVKVGDVLIYDIEDQVGIVISIDNRFKKCHIMMSNDDSRPSELGFWFMENHFEKVENVG